MWQALQDVAGLSSADGAARRAELAWRAFVLSDGQEHWRCPCGEWATQHGEAGS